MKKRQIFAATAVLMVMVSAITTVPINAAGTDYTSIKGGTTAFNKYLVMDVEATVPNVSFIFNVEAGTAQSAEDGTLAVLAGVQPGNVKITGGSTTENKVEFKQGTDTATAEASVGTETPVFKTADTTDEQFAKKELTVDFTGVTFTEPGVYRYVITESGTNKGVTNGYEGDGKTAVTTRTIDVYVEDAKAWYDAQTDKTDLTDPGDKKQLKVTEYVMYSGTYTDNPSATAAAVDGKSNSITNKYSSYDLDLSKTVTGNQGSKDKYFKFEIKIEGTAAGTKYDVDITNADAMVPATDSLNSATDSNYAGQTNDSSITVPEGATTVTKYFYLQHGQSIKIKGLAEGTQYTITEVPEDYTPTASVTGDTKTGDKYAEGTNITLVENAITDDWIKNDTEVAFTNDRSGVIPTGIILSVAVPALVGIAVIGGIIALTVIRKKREYEE